MADWVFLFEESLGNFVPEQFGERTGATVRRHAEVFRRGAEDVDWIPQAATGGWVIVSKDKRIRTRLLELAALREAGARLSYLRYGHQTKEQMVETLVSGYAEMVRMLEATVAPFVARVSPTGRVEVVEG